MIRSFSFLAIVLLSSFFQLNAQTRDINGPTGSKSFGSTVTLLANGNYVVSDPDFEDGTTQAVGAVHLYNGKTHTLISTLKGSDSGSHVSSGGVVALSNGNFVVLSPSWKNGTLVDAGAVTFCNGTSGVSGYVSASNSLVGDQAGHSIGSAGVTALSNGNYVVSSPHWCPNSTTLDYGAVTWCNGTSGRTGLVSTSNSLTGTGSDDLVGSHGSCALTNGNYVVLSPDWANGNPMTLYRAGAATWANGSTGLVGLVSVSNSLVGNDINDRVGDSAKALTNGNYVVYCRDWNNGANNYKVGAVTWGDGKFGTAGIVSPSNSIVGANPNDQVSNGGIILLPNGNYLIYSRGPFTSSWAALTWCNGRGGTTGVLSASNSLTTGPNGGIVGWGGITVLTNGNYVVSTPDWQNGTLDGAGAVTWCNGNTGRSGYLSAANSLVGGTKWTYVGRGGVTALTNGNYVVSSPFWTATNYFTDAGAVTWGDGRTGLVGVVSPANSLVGKDAKAYVGKGGVTALSNGHYVVNSPSWVAMGVTGGITWCDGTKPTSDSVMSSNSLVGGSNDYVGYGGVVALTNGNYVVCSPYWNNGSIVEAGAVTWCDGSGITSDTVSARNSLVGTHTQDHVGIGDYYVGAVALKNGNYVVTSQEWDNGNVVNAGALTFGDGTKALSGPVSSSNSLVGSVADDNVGNYLPKALPGGHYIARHSVWDNGSVANAGAITWGNGATGVSGPVTSCNSVLGNVFDARLDLGATVYDSVSGQLIVGKKRENMAVVFIPTGHTLASNTTSATQEISGNSMAPFVDSNCQLIATVKANGASPLSGNVTSTVYLDAAALDYHGQTLVRRHYDISPDNNPSIATSSVTLYFEQSDFDDYNSINTNGVNLPTGPSDAAGISALRITQYHGTSATGDPGTYGGWAGSGSPVVKIDPADSDIFWNSLQGRWEVRFDVTGFSGFFAHSDIPLKADGTLRSGNVSLMPNPATDHILIRNSYPSLSGTVAVISDMQGREMQRIVLGAEVKINIASWPAGVYTLKLKNGTVQRFVKR